LEKIRQKEEYVGADGEIKYKYLKPAWKFSQKGKFIERSFNREFHEPYLPPISDRGGYKHHGLFSLKTKNIYSSPPPQETKYRSVVIPIPHNIVPSWSL
jgi:hypothetical protein